MARTRTARSRGTGGDVPVIRALRADWETIARSRPYRRALSEWAGTHRALAGLGDGVAVVAQALNGHEDQRLEIFEALGTVVVVDDVVDDLALRTLLHALLPRVVALLNRSHHTGIDIEDRADQLLLIAGETIRSCRPDTAGTNYDFRLWSNMRRSFVRWCAAQQRQPDTDRWERSIDDYAAELHPELQDEFSPSEDHQLADLCSWVAAEARINLSTARLIVLTRAGGVPLEAVISGLSAGTARKRRSRGEQRLGAALVAS